MPEPLIANNLRAERVAAGFETVEELAEKAGIDPTWCAYIEDGEVLASREEYERLLAALGDIPANRIYEGTWRQLTMIDRRPNMAAQAHLWRAWRDERQLMMSRDELNFYDRHPGLDHDVDVYVNMSCGTQRSPHLLLDTVRVLEALGVSFVAGAGPGAACCGKPIARNSTPEAFERHRTSRIERSQAWGASVHVNWCGGCQQTATAAAARHELTGQGVHPVREVQLIPFLEERVRVLGDKAPWKKDVRRRVLAEGHSGQSNVHYGSQLLIPKLLSMVPGVEVAGLYDGWWELSPCAAFGLEGSPAPAWTERPESHEELEEHRRRLAADVRARGADTVTCMHFACHQMWSRYASDDLDVVHPISVLAEALDCAHPDRYQEAVRHGDAKRLLEESRPRWESWRMSEQRAAEVAEAICTVGSAANVGYEEQDAKSYATTRRYQAGSFCGGCGGGGCQTHIEPRQQLAPPA